MANTVVRYCQAGHAFHITGNMSVGNTITVEVHPLSGYRFVKWTDGNTDNPRTIHIEECGITYVGIFEESGVIDDRPEIFERLSIIIDGPDNTDVYVETSITEDEISNELDEIING